jgi:hypothetical protein
MYDDIVLQGTVPLRLNEIVSTDFNNPNVGDHLRW